MKVKDLKEILSRYDDDAEIELGYYSYRGDKYAYSPVDESDCHIQGNLDKMLCVEGEYTEEINPRSTEVSIIFEL